MRIPGGHLGRWFLAGITSASILALGLTVAVRAEIKGPVRDFDPAAQIFSKANVDYLCPTWIEPRTVDRTLLARMVVDLVRVPPHILRRANSLGQEASLPIPSSHYENYVSLDAPFGPHPGKDLDDAIEEQQIVRSRLDSWFTRVLQGGKSEFSIELAGGTPQPVYFYQFFSTNSPITIKCRAEKKGKTKENEQTGATTNEGDKLGAVLSKIKSSIVIRKSVEDISVESNKIKKANGAIFSYTDDAAGNFHSYSIEGLVGIIIAGTGADRVDGMESARKSRQLPGNDEAGDRSFYWYKVTPYLYHQRFDRTPDSKSARDIDLLRPGVAANVTWVSSNGDLAFDLLGDAAKTIDRAQDSSLYDASISISPSFRLGNTVIFNAPLFLGPFGFRPNLAFVAREYVIEERGRNAQLKGQNSFGSYGADSEVKIFLWTKNAFLAAFEGRVAYTYMVNTGVVPDISRFEYKLSFSPPGTENLTFDLEYVDGRNKKTLVDEERWTAGVGFRF